MAGPPGGIRILITWGEDYDNTVRLASKAAKYRSTGSYMGIVIYLVCAIPSTSTSSATCWEIEVRKKKRKHGIRTGSTLREGLRSPGSLVKIMCFADHRGDMNREVIGGI